VTISERRLTADIERDKAFIPVSIATISSAGMGEICPPVETATRIYTWSCAKKTLPLDRLLSLGEHWSRPGEVRDEPAATHEGGANLSPYGQPARRSTLAGPFQDREHHSIPRDRGRRRHRDRREDRYHIADAVPPIPDMAGGVRCAADPGGDDDRNWDRLLVLPRGRQVRTPGRLLSQCSYSLHWASGETGQ
jgi:hypothetical protein